MKTWIFFFLFIICVVGEAQTNIDSLRKVWVNQSQPDSIRFKAFSDLIWDGYRKQKPDSAILLSQKLIEFAIAKKNSIWQCKATNYLGVCYESNNQIELAQKTYEKALNIALTSKNNYWAGVLNFNLGILNKNQGKLEIALKYFTTSSNYLQYFPQKEIYNNTFLQLGKVNLELENHLEAITNFNLALANMKKNKDNVDVLNTILEMNNVYKTLNRADLELKLWQENLKFFKEENYLLGEAESFGEIGLLYSLKFEHERALPYYFESIELYEQIGDTLRTAKPIGNIGYSYFLLGDYDRALFYSLRGLKRNKKINDKLSLSHGFEILGEIHQEFGRFDSAYSYHQKSLKLRQEIGQEALSYYMLSNFYLLKGELNNALSYSDKSFEVYNQKKDYYQLQLVVKTRKKILKKLEKGMEALAMFELEIALTDSLKTDEFKSQAVALEASAKFEKQQYIKEQEAKEAARIEAEKVARRNSIQYSGIGLGIFTLFGLVFLFGRIQLPKWAVELSVFLPFLIFFEFLLVITDPYVDAWSEGVPLIKLGINVVMAAAIFPLHSFFEGFLKNRLFQSK